MAQRGRLQFLFLILFIFPLAAQSSSVTSDGYLRDFQSDDEHVAYAVEDGNVTSVMTADDERLVLRKYDTKHRLVSEVVWSADYSAIVSDTSWTYPAEGVFPEAMVKQLPEQKQTVKVFYSAAGLETERTTWQQGAGGQADTLLEKTVWQYDDKKRVTSKTHETHTADAAGKETVKTEKTEYLYTDKASDPDMSYWENGVLIQKTEYLKDDCYVESLFFEDMEIKTTWDAGVKTDEVYYLDGKEIKRKTL